MEKLTIKYESYLLSKVLTFMQVDILIKIVSNKI